MKKVSEGIGVMSGTSLDGIDLAWCRFEKDDIGKWNYRIEKATNMPYSEAFKTRLANAPYLSALEYVKLNNDVAEVFAEAINSAPKTWHWVVRVHRSCPSVMNCSLASSMPAST